MKASELFFPTLREVPHEAEVISHQLLLRAGFIRKSSAGVYTYLPLAYKVIKKIIQIVREEMDKAGGQEVLMPIIQNKELWEKTGRWELYGAEMFRLQDRQGRDFALAPTHEELVTSLVAAEVHSYRSLPLMIYQIQNKYRDEIRPRYGLMRGREFIMKDLYSFDLDEVAMDKAYRKMHQAYCNIYRRLGLDYRVVEADSGEIGGNESHEFIVMANNGESLIVYCEQCDYAANVEKAPCVYPLAVDLEERLPLEKLYTPNQKTIEDLVIFCQEKAEKMIKTLFYLADDELIAVIIRGDRELNEMKLKTALNVKQLSMAEEAEVKDKVGVSFGSLGPKELSVRLIADKEITRQNNYLAGANQEDYHYKNINWERDFEIQAFYDLRNASSGDICPKCQENYLRAVKGIEVAHIFKLGDKYSWDLDACYTDKDDDKKPIIMGCYGIGISRTMAAAIEQKHDENGIIWPISIAPYQVIIVLVNSKKPEQYEVAEKIYQQLIAAGIDVILDDRDERAGVKFKDADLIGIPLRITVGAKSLAEGRVELKLRHEKELEQIALADIKPRVIKLIASINNDKN